VKTLLAETVLAWTGDHGVSLTPRSRSRARYSGLRLQFAKRRLREFRHDAPVLAFAVGVNAMACAVVSGCATGIGAATRARLEAQGNEVIGIDLAGVEVEADLSQPSSREAAAAAVLELPGGRIDRALMCAGLGGHIDDIAAVVSVNYFGAVDLLDGLLPALREGEAPAAVAICSNSAQLWESVSESDFVQSLLDHDEARARAGKREQRAFKLRFRAMSDNTRICQLAGCTPWGGVACAL
jgi:NAD(P)-dependent dehydrogenase (short-subunit alcohol dehydrogenase family)